MEYRIITSQRGGIISKEKKYLRNNQKVFLKKRYFRNEYPMSIPVTSDGKELKLVVFADIPIINDFEIVLRDNGKKYGFSLFYYSPTYNILTKFLCWDNVEKDLKKMKFSDIPSGDLKNAILQHDKTRKDVTSQTDYWEYVS